MDLSYFIRSSFDEMISPGKIDCGLVFVEYFNIWQKTGRQQLQTDAISIALHLYGCLFVLMWVKKNCQSISFCLFIRQPKKKILTLTDCWLSVNLVYNWIKKAIFFVSPMRVCECHSECMCVCLSVAVHLYTFFICNTVKSEKYVDTELQSKRSPTRKFN